jgi:hypothetical protein
VLHAGQEAGGEAAVIRVLAARKHLRGGWVGVVVVVVGVGGGGGWWALGSRPGRARPQARAGSRPAAAAPAPAASAPRG